MLDFEDLPLTCNYVVTDTFTTSDIDVLVRPFTFSGGGTYTSGNAQVQNGGLAGGNGNELAVNNVLLQFLPGSTTDMIPNFASHRSLIPFIYIHPFTA